MFCWLEVNIEVLMVVIVTEFLWYQLICILNSLSICEGTGFDIQVLTGMRPVD